MNYIHHTNNVIDRATGSLPRAWGRVSGLDKATAIELQGLGWLPVVESKPDYDPATERLVGPTSVLIGDTVPVDSSEVVAVWVAVAYTPPVPQSVTPLQARRALRAAGLLPTVEAWVANADDDTKDAWAVANVIDRDGAIIKKAARVLGLSDKQLDGLFSAAEKL